MVNTVRRYIKVDVNVPEVSVNTRACTLYRQPTYLLERFYPKPAFLRLHVERILNTFIDI